MTVQLEYGREPRREGWTGAILSSVLVGVWVGLVGWTVTFWGPRFENIFADFGVALPAATAMALQVTRLLAWQNLWLVLLVLVAAPLLLRHRRGRRVDDVRPSAALTLLWAILALAPLALWWLAMVLPMLTLVEAVG